MILPRVFPDLCWRAAKMLYEAAVEIGRTAETDAIGDLGNGARILADQVHRPV